MLYGDSEGTSSESSDNRNGNPQSHTGKWPIATTYIRIQGTKQWTVWFPVRNEEQMDDPLTGCISSSMQI